MKQSGIIRERVYLCAVINYELIVVTCSSIAVYLICRGSLSSYNLQRMSTCAYYIHIIHSYNVG